MRQLSNETKEKIRQSRLGKKASEETKKKMSERMKGNKNLLGYIPSEETRKKISEAGKGRKQSEYNIQRIKETWTGRKHTEESKNKMRLSKLGKKMKLCSLETRTKLSLGQRGEKGSNWKGGLTVLSYSIRNSFKMRQWRSDVFTRDDYTCQECGIRSGNGKTVVLNADHINSFASIISRNNIKNTEEAYVCEELWNINNGRTLCIDCHKKTDTYGGKSHQVVNEKLKE